MITSIYLRRRFHGLFCLVMLYYAMKKGSFIIHKGLTKHSQDDSFHDGVGILAYLEDSDYENTPHTLATE